MSVTSTVTASPMFTLGVTETLNGEGVANQIVAHSAHEVRPGNLSSSSTTAPVDATSQQAYSLAAGTKTIDLQALATLLSATANWAGKKIQGLRFTNIAGNAAMSITGEGANGYSLSGAIPIPAPSANSNCVVVIWNPEAFADVAAGDRYLVVTGTGTEQFYLDLIAG